METLREKALAAYKASQEEQERAEAEKKRETEERMRAAFERYFGIEPDEVDGARVRAGDIVVEGRPQMYSSRVVFHLVAPCPRCGELAAGDKEISDLSTLGEALCEPFKADYRHEFCCPKREPRPEERDWAMRFKELLEELLHG